MRDPGLTWPAVHDLDLFILSLVVNYMYTFIVVADIRDFGPCRILQLRARPHPQLQLFQHLQSVSLFNIDAMIL